MVVQHCVLYFGKENVVDVIDVGMLSAEHVLKHLMPGFKFQCFWNLDYVELCRVFLQPVVVLLEFASGAE